jgi:hypothetical protein
MTPLARITERVNRLGHPDNPQTPRPLLTVEEFFEGNTEIGSIGCNLLPTPSPEIFHDLLKALGKRPDVKDIRVQVTAFDVPEWPFSDTVYIMTSAESEVVMSWFPEGIRPDETWSGFADMDFEPYEVPQGTRAVGCWWD